MANQQQTSTGASNIEYDLLAEMYALLKGNAALEQYIQDAKQAGETELESCFKQIHDQNRDNVSALRQLISKRLHAQAA
jgi:hypothetical protein